MRNTIVNDIIRLIDVNTPIICINDYDFARVDDIIAEAAGKGSKITEWNPSIGACRFSTKERIGVSEVSLENFLIELLQKEASELNPVIFKDYYVLREIQSYFDINNVNTKVVATLQLLAQRKLYDRSFDCTFFIVNSGGRLPAEIEKYVSYVEIDFPSDSELDEIIEEHIKINNAAAISDEDFRKLRLSLKGMSHFEVDRALDMAMSNNGTLSAKDTTLILQQKKQMVKKSGLVELIDAKEKLEDIGGLDALKAYLERKAKVFKDWAKADDFGVKTPKGIFIVGMPGCGKSLCAKAAAATFEAPLLKMDMGSMMGKYVGQSEENLRKAIRIAEAAAPCILWIDEIEKAFSGVGGNNDIMTRMFGYFLSWLQEKKSSVYVIATANNADNLPPELKRKGRFDEIFCVNLPNAEELKAIFTVHLSKLRKKHPEDIDKLLKLTQELGNFARGFNGADVESVINETVEKCFLEGKKIDYASIKDTISKTVCISKSCKKQIDSMRKIFDESSFIDATTGEMTGKK